MSGVEAILAERGKTHGDFTEHARITQNMKAMMRPWYDGLSSEQIESLEMIAHKVGRILAGNPNHADHWDDIAGYATLVSQRLPKAEIPKAYFIDGKRVSEFDWICAKSREGRAE